MNIKLSRWIAAIIAVIVTLGEAWLAWYLTCPAINFRSAGFWTYLFIMLIILLINMAIANAIRKVITEDYGDFDDFGSNSITYITLGIVVLFGLAFLITSITGWKCNNWKKYANLIEVEKANFTDDIPEFNAKDAITVDYKGANQLGDRALSTIENASWYDADPEYNLVSIAGNLYRITPINYGGLFKFNQAKEVGIPGFIMVDAKTGEYKVQNFKEPMRYSPSAYWEHDLIRHLRYKFPGYVFANKSFFEVDDDLNPYWITPVRESQAGLYGAQVTKCVIITDAVTGEVEVYSPNAVPEWVDHVESISYLKELVRWHYRYQNGWWNPSKTNIFNVSSDYNSVVTENGEIWFTIGLTPANAAQSNVAFLLMSPKTGEVRRYEAYGASEKSAQSAAAGLVQDMGYTATFPIIINIDGNETYYMLLKDSEGLVRNYALCNVEQYTIVVQAESVEKAVQLYKDKLAVSGNASNDYQSEIIGYINECGVAQIDGFTYYYFTIVGTDLIFKSSIQNNSMQPIKIKEGQKVTVEYYLSSEDGIAIVTSITFTD